MDVSKDGGNSGIKPPSNKTPRQLPNSLEKKPPTEKSSSASSATTEKSSLSSSVPTETSSSALSVVEEKSTSESSVQTLSEGKVENIQFLEALPRSMNTRRRYSAFRPVPFPSRWDEERTAGEAEEDSSLLLAGDDIEEKISVGLADEGRRAASDLDVFLTNRLAQNRLKKGGRSDDLPDQLNQKGYSSGILFSFIFLFALFTLCQLVTFSCLLGVGEIETEGGMNVNGSTTEAPHRQDITFMERQRQG